jgi:hypothetical protein
MVIYSEQKSVVFGGVNREEQMDDARSRSSGDIRRMSIKVRRARLPDLRR